MTLDAVERTAIPAPLMIMRSDGGVMDVREIERRPILTLLSGPAAGVAGALLYENVSDGIFVEVGGTSSDCSAIRAGRPQMRPARIGGHRTMLHTLDVRTIGIAGGSMVRLGNGGIADVGPRSAHIAGCAYACFTDEATIANARLETIAPTPHDPADYVAFVAGDGTRIALTTTCAANALGNRARTAPSRAATVRARCAPSECSRERNGGDAAVAGPRGARDCSRANFARSSTNSSPTTTSSEGHVVVVGGGGGAGALVPFTAESMRVPYRIARDAEVISPVGVALALVRDVVERTIASPTPSDIARMRREATDRVVAAGAAIDRVEVTVEIDPRRNRVRATASGATALADAVDATPCDETARRRAAAHSLQCEPAELERVELTAPLAAYLRRLRIRRSFGREREIADLRIVDERGVVRLALRDAAILATSAGDAESAVRGAVERATRFGDVGRALPALHLVRRARIATFDGFADAEQAIALAAQELEGCDPDERVAILTTAATAA